MIISRRALRHILAIAAGRETDPQADTVLQEVQATALRLLEQADRATTLTVEVTIR